MPVTFEQPTVVRAFFEKSGRAVYISHLDLTRAMSRALVRSGLPVWYTQGFHPHLYMTFALPLSLGVTGERETVDFKLTAPVAFPEITERLDAALPEGLRALDAGLPVMQPKEIMWADYRIGLRCEPERGAAAVEALAAQGELFVEKRSKKGISTVDIRPLFSVLDAERGQRGITLRLRCRAGVETNLNPALVCDTLTQQGLDVAQRVITRTAIRTEALEEFR